MTGISPMWLILERGPSMSQLEGRWENISQNFSLKKYKVHIWILLLGLISILLISSFLLFLHICDWVFLMHMSLRVLMFPDTLTANKSLFHRILVSSYLQPCSQCNAYSLFKSPVKWDTTLLKFHLRRCCRFSSKRRETKTAYKYTVWEFNQILSCFMLGNRTNTSEWKSLCERLVTRATIIHVQRHFVCGHTYLKWNECVSVLLLKIFTSYLWIFFP